MSRKDDFLKQEMDFEYSTRQETPYTGPDIETGMDAAKQAAAWMAKVMGWMCLGLLTTTAVAMLCASVPAIQYRIATDWVLFFGIFIVQIILASTFTFRLQKMSSGAAVVCFMLYAVTVGITFSVLQMSFALSSIILTFGVTALMFLIMAVFGIVTGKDLTKVGSLAFFGLIGIIIGSVVNMFLGNTMFDLLITVVGIVIFVALIAYDTQKIKNFYVYGTIGTTPDQQKEQPVHKNLAVYGAFILYLDFINLFLRLLRLFGRRRN